MTIKKRPASALSRPGEARAAAAISLASSLAWAGAAAAQQTAPDQVIGESAKAAEATEEAPPPAEDAEDPSRETDISEDNYRRYMELDDRQLERRPFPPTAYAPRSGLTKVEQLPEASQKHLRNQLRGLILARGAWTPAERDRPYPFVPSEAARRDASLLRQEAEAWAELVAEYHDREEAIRAERMARSGARDRSGAQEAGREGPPGQTPAGTGNGAAGERAAGASGPGGQDGGAPGAAAGDAVAAGSSPGGAAGQGSEGNAAAASQAASDAARRTVLPPPESPTGPETPGATSDEGVEQSAADYLRERGLTVNGTTEAPPAANAPPPTDPGRWGEQSQTLLPRAEPTTAADEAAPSARLGTGMAAGRDAAAAGPGDERGDGNVLTLEELLRVRGIGEEGREIDAAPPDGG